jgi:hypothetical protein
MICIGTYLIWDIPLEHEPSRDKSIRRNSEILAALPEPFSARFHGGATDCDGVLEWHRELELSCPSKDGSVQVRIRRLRVPLEVGYTRASRTLVRLEYEGALARWPYGHHSIRVILRKDLAVIVDGEKS